jgi:serine kinase
LNQNQNKKEPIHLECSSIEAVLSSLDSSSLLSQVISKAMGDRTTKDPNKSKGREKTNPRGGDKAQTLGAYRARKPRNILANEDLADVKELLKSKHETLHEKIGCGNFAVVHRGVHKNSMKNVAIKIIDLRKTSAHYREMMLPQEMSIMRKLKHPNIIKIYHMAQVGEKVVLVMEYAAKGTLSDLVCHLGGLVEEVAWHTFSKAFAGLAFMHNGSIAHRDLKLDNILIDHNNIPKLADFSFAVFFDGSTMCTNACGSIPYFAPELLMPNPSYNPLVSDIWSMGVCLYIISNDTFPFIYEEGKDKQLLAAQQAKQWSLRPRAMTYSRPYQDLMPLMLDPSVDTRIRTSKLATHPWLTIKQSIVFE